ncbi:MAG: thymidine kinase [Bacteroidia bacterium]|nr:thymidine kinase [Bacteroidia bacterium]
MFLENKQQGRSRGWIEVICGSMFSGKTEELIRRLKRARIAQQKVEIFKPALDRRYHEQDIVSHDAQSVKSTPVESSSQILLLVGEVDVVAIDEAQFFDDELSNVCEALANRGIRVIVAGLDMDYLGKPFGPLPSLLSVAEYVTKVHAICIRCGELAHYSFRTTDNAARILLGEQESYLPLCRSCFMEKMDKKN